MTVRAVRVRPSAARCRALADHPALRRMRPSSRPDGWLRKGPLDHPAARPEAAGAEGQAPLPRLLRFGLRVSWGAYRRWPDLRKAPGGCRLQGRPPAQARDFRVGGRRRGVAPGSGGRRVLRVRPIRWGRPVRLADVGPARGPSRAGRRHPATRRLQGWMRSAWTQRAVRRAGPLPPWSGSQGPAGRTLPQGRQAGHPVPGGHRALLPRYPLGFHRRVRRARGWVPPSHAEPAAMRAEAATRGPPPAGRRVFGQGCRGPDRAAARADAAFPHFPQVQDRVPARKATDWPPQVPPRMAAVRHRPARGRLHRWSAVARHREGCLRSGPPWPNRGAEAPIAAAGCHHRWGAQSREAADRTGRRR